MSWALDHIHVAQRLVDSLIVHYRLPIPLLNAHALA
jgi:hypothetical protein